MSRSDRTAALYSGSRVLRDVVLMIPLREATTCGPSMILEIPERFYSGYRVMSVFYICTELTALCVQKQNRVISTYLDCDRSQRMSMTNSVAFWASFCRVYARPL